MVTVQTKLEQPGWCPAVGKKAVFMLLMPNIMGSVMEKFTRQEIEKRKKAIFEAMSVRGQRRILRLGYDKWDPFQDPKDPIEIRKDSTNRTLSQLVGEYFEQNFPREPSAKYRQGVLEMALGLMNNDDRYQAMFEFACWYAKLKSDARRP